MSVPPPKWAKRVRFVRDDGKIDPGPKLLWLTMWGYASVERARDDAGENRMPVRVWPTRATLAEELGESVDTIKGWLKRLKGSGRVRRVGRVWELAVVEPFVADGQHPPTRVSTNPGQHQPGGRVSADPGGGLALTRVEGWHQPTEEEKKKKGSKESEGQRAIAIGTASTNHQDRAIADPRTSLTRERDDIAYAAIDSVIAERQAEREPAEAAARHGKIVGQQARLHPERKASREHSRRSDRAKLSPEIKAAVQAAGPLWVRELDTQRGDGRPSWVDELEGAVLELSLTPAQVTAVLVAWDAAEVAAGGPLAVARLPATGGHMPPRHCMWWRSWRHWVAAQLDAGEPARKREQGRSGLGCGWAENTPSSRRSFVQRKPGNE